MKKYHPLENRYDEMQYRRCGKSGLKLPAVSLGLWQNFGGADSPGSMRERILRAFDLGITHFDLGNNYGPPPGSAEVNFGKILREDLASYRDELIVATKAGYRMWPGPYGEWGSRKYLLSSLDQSLKRMGLEYVDIFYLHRPDPETPLEESMSALDHAVRAGKALYAGVSSLSAEQTLEASKILRRLGTPCLIHQPVYNMLNRSVEGGLLDVLRSEGIGCISFSPLAQGLLTDKYLDGIPENSRAAQKDSSLRRESISAQRVDTLRTLNGIAKKRGQSLAQMSLAWVLRHDIMTSVVIGASRVEQIEENVAALKRLDFTPEELAAIEGVLKG
ncbi:MAG TPA: L-glyceraldehyde 3-phosphate reductase [Bacteroidota bacterium]|jgi:L-glyceraldehyde 3-phosphate reductase